MIQAAEKKLEAATGQGQGVAGDGGPGVESSMGSFVGPKEGDMAAGVSGVECGRMPTGGVIGVKRSYPEKGDQ